METRTRKDIDIARMSALKSAVEITVAYHDNVVSQDRNAIDVALAAAGKFLNWILDTEAQSVPANTPAPAREAAGSQQPVNQPATSATTAQEIADFKTHLAKDATLYRELSFAELDGTYGNPNHWIQRSVHTFATGKNNDPYPISQKQFGFLVGLHKKLNTDPDAPFLNGLSSHGASEMIKKLQEMVEANGNGKPNQASVERLKNQMRRRGVA